MNKIRKPRTPSSLALVSQPEQQWKAPQLSSTPTQSRTLQYALSLPSQRTQITAQTTGEKYWATRALMAETLLASQVSQVNLSAHLSLPGDHHRLEEIEKLKMEVHVKQARLEKLMMIFLCSLIVLLVIVVYLLYRSQRPVHHRPPYHFTIPILSPFTSVIETETSTFGTTTIVALGLILACFLYAAYRHWFNKTHGSRR
ncbi:hypothetical protein JAAARDRAFT_59053 [Jaapia argillacea MUCL 33604]|uniref:Uncharacterized protein n=1 Tax=Jaapia argillacea MUCL 33604 TaxID=933084 RepID=A0A067PPT2_9AGAM|nr:hypothetical protein JAAARDRAFT_59053 [Jaapia argillacea MUCL 33604]